jgi:hypothetical protein
LAVGPSKLDTVIGLLMIVGPWAVGGLLGHRFGRTTRGLLGVIGAGLVVTALGLLGFFLTADSWATSDCRECSQYLGRAIDRTIVVDWPIYTAASWGFAALFAGTVARDRRQAARPGNGSV